MRTLPRDGRASVRQTEFVGVPGARPSASEKAAIQVKGRLPPA